MIEINYLPSWFKELNSSKSFFEHLKNLKPDKKNTIFIDLVNIFGMANQTRIATFLPECLKEKFKITLCNRRERFNAIFKIAINDLVENRPINLEKLQPFYKLSARSIDDPRELAIQEILQYLLSHAMMDQESRALGCRSVKAFKEFLDVHQAKSEKIIDSIFFKTHINQVDEILENIQEEQVIFKSAAIKGHGQIRTWGSLLCFWATRTSDTQLFRTKINKQFYFDKILLSEEERIIPEKQLPKTSFQNFVIKSTLQLFFEHPKTLLPKGFVDKQLEEIFKISEISRRDAMYYVETLHNSYNTSIKDSTSFPFKECLQILNKLIPDPTSEIYPFLYAFLHYFRMLPLGPLPNSSAKDSTNKRLEKFIIEPTVASFVLEALQAAVRGNPICEYEKPIIETFIRQPFIIDEAFVELTREKIPLAEIGRIFLKFSQTKPSEIKLIECPYLTSKQHVELFQNIEDKLGLQIPGSIIFDFLFFQTAKPEVFQTVEKLSNIRSLIIAKHLNTICIPLELYQSWELSAHDLISWIQLDLKGNFPHAIREKLSLYTNKVFQLGVFMQLAAYPQPMSSMSSLMPNGMKDGKLKFNSEGKRDVSLVRLIHPDFSIGPAIFCRWFFNEKINQFCLCVSILNSLQNPRSSCTFQVPLNIPNFEHSHNSFFIILENLVDTLGKETLSDSEAQSMKEISSSPYSIPDDDYFFEGEECQKFDKMINHSPLLEKLWNKYIPIENIDIDSMKKNLHDFIKNLRSGYKKAFYFVLKPKELFCTIEQERMNFRVFQFDNVLSATKQDFLFQLLENIYKEIGSFSNGQTQTFSLPVDFTTQIVPVNFKILKTLLEEERKEELFDSDELQNDPVILYNITLSVDARNAKRFSNEN